MADESIIIEVTDKVASTPADKFRQMAEEALKANAAIATLQKSISTLPTSSVAKIATSLNQIATATTKVTSAEIKMSAEAGKAALVQQKLATEVANTARAEALAEAAKNRLAAASVKVTVAEKQLGETQAEAIARISKLVAVQNQDYQAKAKVAEVTKVLTEAEKQARLASVAETQARINAANAKELDAQKAAEVAAANLKAAQTATKAARDQINAREAEAAANQKAKAAADAYNATLAKTGNTSRITAMQMRSIISASRDVAGSLSAGASLSTVALQQGPQFAQAFSKEIGVLLRTMGPLIGILGLTAGAVITLGLAYNTAKEQQAQFNNALIVTGNYAGITEDNIIQMSEGIANASGKSVAASREIAQAFVASGQFQRDTIEQNSVSVLKLSKLTSQSASDIAKSFNQMADSPTAFAESLNKAYHFLSSAQLTQIRQLEEQGQKTKATEQVSRALYEYLANVDDASLGPLSAGWNTVSKAISNAYTSLQQFVNGAGPTARLSEISIQLKQIADSQKINPNAPSDQIRIEQLNKEYGLLAGQIMLEEENARKKSETLKVQAEGYEASKRISNEYLKTVDNVNKADAAVQKFRDSIKSALAANPNDKDALAAQAKSKEIEKKLREQNMPETKKSDTKGESRALAIAKINSELQKQVDGLGVLAPQREIQQKLDQYEIDLASRKIKLNADERKSIEDKLLAIQDYARAQTETDRIFEEATGPLKTYNAVITAANALLKSGAIDQAEHAKQVTKASEAYQNTIDPLRQTNMRLDQELSLLKLAQPEREIAQQMMQVENQLRANGQSLIDAGTGALKKEGEALKEKLTTQQQLTQVQQAYDSIYAQTVGAETANAAAVKATTQARKDGIISAQQYGLQMNQLAIQAANLRIAADNALPGDAALASFGQVIEGYKGMIAGLTDTFGNMFSSVVDGFANSAAAAIVTGKSFEESLASVAQSAVQEFIAQLIKMGVQYTINQALGIQSATAVGAAQVAASGAATAASVAGTATAATASVAAGATVATAWAPAAIWASIGSFGQAAVIAGGAILGVMALTGGFKKGGYTGDAGTSTAVGVVHGQEFVMNAEATKRIGVDNLQAMQDGRMNSVQNGSNTVVGMQGPAGANGSNSVGSSPSITFTVVNNVDGAKVTTSKQEDQDGNVDVVMTLDAIEQGLATRVASGRGSLNRSIGTSFGLNAKPNGG